MAKELEAGEQITGSFLDDEDLPTTPKNKATDDNADGFPVRRK